MDNEQLKSNLMSSKHWLRLIFMLVFVAVLQLASIVMWTLVAAQFLFSLITGEDNLHLRRFGDSLSRYIFDVFRFLCYSSEEKPFPFADWPEAQIDAEAQVEAAASAVAKTPAKKSTARKKTDDSASDGAGH